MVKSYHMFLIILNFLSSANASNLDMAKTVLSCKGLMHCHGVAFVKGAYERNEFFEKIN